MGLLQSTHRCFVRLLCFFFFFFQLQDYLNLVERSPYLSCNQNGAALTLQEYATVPAGTAVTAYWNNPWPHNIGPVLTYMANCNGDCSKADTSSLEWFKIAASGLISGVQDGGTWAQGVLISQNSSWTTTVPSNLAPGNYFFRNELIALHTSNQPQFYPECAQFKVTGSGTGVPSGSYLTKFPGAYSMNDPGININIYTQAGSTETNYTIPGPPVWT